MSPPQGRGKVAHTLTNALALNASGHDVKVLFEGQGVEWLRLFEQREDGFSQGYGRGIGFGRVTAPDRQPVPVGA